MKPVAHASLFVDQLIACTDKQLQVRVQVSGVHPGQVRFAQRHPSDHDRVTFVVLTGSTAPPPSLGGEGRRHVNDGLAGSEQPLSERPAVSLGALDGDLTGSRQGLDPAEEVGEFARIGRDRAFGDHPALWVDRGRRMHLAVRVDADGGENLHDCPFVMHR